MRVLMTLHHPIGENSGAAGVTVSIANALRAAGCSITFFGHGEAFGKLPQSLLEGAQFPLRVASYLSRNAARYDIIDASSGDAWVWATLGRPGSARATTLITRSHGLEHTVDQALRDDVRAGKTHVRRRYYLYHGGLRLWEVSRSLTLADHAILLNDLDLEFSRRSLGVSASRSSTILHGLDNRFLGRDVIVHTRDVVRLAYIGSWIYRKGVSTIVSSFSRLVDAEFPVRLSIFGSSGQPNDVLRDFPDAARSLVEVIPRYRNEELPDLLKDSDILLSPSRAEGMPISLIEGMASGLAPIATPVGAAPQIVKDGVNGIFFTPGDDEALTRAILSLSDNRPRLLAMRRAARDSVANLSWDSVAQSTLEVYRKAQLARLADI